MGTVEKAPFSVYTLNGKVFGGTRDGMLMEWGSDYVLRRSQMCAVRMAAGPVRQSCVTSIMSIGPLLFVGNKDGRVTVWDLHSLEFVTQMKVHAEPSIHVVAHIHL